MDVETIVAWADDADLVRWSRIPQPYTRAHAHQWVTSAAEGWATGGLFQFGIESGGALVGDLNLRPAGGGLAEVGFALARTYRGQGLISRALRLALPWAFDRVDGAGLEVVHWRAATGNWASRRVAWAVGLRIDEPVAGLVETRGGGRVDGWLAALRRGDELRPAHPWYDPVRITGRSVVLRAYRETDVPRIVEACRDPLTQHWLSGLPGDYSEVSAREHLERCRAHEAAGRAVAWAAADPVDDRLLAEVILFVRDQRAGVGEIGYWAHPDARGRGVVTEAVQLAARHALLPLEAGGLGWSQLLLRAADGNGASQRVAAKAGFTLSGRDREVDPRRDGTRDDDLRFDLLARELPARR